MKRLFCTFLLCIGFTLSPLIAHAVDCDLSKWSGDSPPSDSTDRKYVYDKVDNCVDKRWRSFTGLESLVFVAYCHEASGCVQGYKLSDIVIENTSEISELSGISHLCNSFNPLKIPNCVKKEQDTTGYCTPAPLSDNANECSHTVYAANCDPSNDTKYAGIIRGDYGNVCVFNCAQEKCWHSMVSDFSDEIASQFFALGGYDYDLKESLGAQFDSLGLSCQKVNLQTCKWTYKCPTGLYGDITPFPNDQTGLAAPNILGCFLCPENSTTEGSGATKQSECKCKENYYGRITDEGGACTACPEHSTSDSNSETIDDCKCDRGYYKSNNRCIKCPALPNGVKGGSDAITTDGAGKESITDCFIRAGSDKSLNDDTGYFYFTENCNYKISAD